jgi:cytochrome c5
MMNSRLLTAAVALIVVGIAGVAVVSWFGTHHAARGLIPATDMMADRGMMNMMMDREGMKEMMKQMMPGMLPPAIKPEELPDPDSQGAKLTNRYCSQCHDLPSPRMHSAQEWPQVTSRMFARMSMMSGMMGVENPSSGEEQTIVAYLKANALKSISPDALPAPRSKGALLFRETCSQCHSLPDPGFHRADEWPVIVGRMQANMRFMGRRVITENEKKEIVGYLSAHAKK